MEWPTQLLSSSCLSLARKASEQTRRPGRIRSSPRCFREKGSTGSRFLLLHRGRGVASRILSRHFERGSSVTLLISPSSFSVWPFILCLLRGFPRSPLQPPPRFSEEMCGPCPGDRRLRNSFTFLSNLNFPVCLNLMPTGESDSTGRRPGRHG